MKKYSSYFNKRYFPEPEDTEEEEPLTGESLTESPEPILETEPELTPSAPQSNPNFQEPNVQFPSFSFGEAESLDQPASPMSQEPEPMPDFSFQIPVPEPEPEPEPQPIPEPPVFHPPVPEPPVDTETTVISKSAIISGELTVSGNVKMYGKIKGNLTAAGNLEIAGKIIGNLSGNDVELNHCELKGDINASGFTFMDKDSIMIGNLASQDVTLDGKVKGDISASHKVYVRSNALIVGNVNAAVIAIDEGATLQGQVIIASQDEEAGDLQIGDDNA